MTVEKQVSDPALESAEIRHQIAETRSDLVEKVELIEHKVMDMVQGATSSVTDTIDSVKESVAHTVEAVGDAVQGTVKSVKHALDIRDHVRQYPWLTLGAALVLGFACGKLLSRR